MEVLKKDNLGLRDVDKFKQATKDLEKEIVKLQAQLQYERQGSGAQNVDLNEEDLAKQKETLTQNHDQMLSDLFMLKKKQSDMQAEKTQQDQRLNDLYIQISKTDEIYNDKLQLLETLKKQIDNINESSEALKGQYGLWKQELEEEQVKMKLDFKQQKYFGSHLRIHTPVSMSILGI